jgi:hypothetical protein
VPPVDRAKDLAEWRLGTICLSRSPQIAKRNEHGMGQHSFLPDRRLMIWCGAMPHHHIAKSDLSDRKAFVLHEPHSESRLRQ